MGLLAALVGSVVKLGAIAESKKTKDLDKQKIYFSGFLGEDDF